MFLALEENLRRAVAEFVSAKWPESEGANAGALAARIVIERPPQPEMGDFALPLCFDLARKLRRPPRMLAQEIATGLALPRGLARAEAAGGYLNVFVDRAWLLAQTAELTLRGGRDAGLRPSLKGKAIVEHTNINPNKAAHIGHLRNAVLGDTFARLLRFRGETVEVQNYIDNTGVQVADVAVGLERLEHEDSAQVQAQAQEFETTRERMAAAGDVGPLPQALPLATGAQREAYAFDYFCWDVYARISREYERDPAKLSWRAEALAAIEHAQETGETNPTAAIAEAVAEAVVTAHLRTMARLNITYDLLPRESEILRLHFWREAFAQMQRQGAIRLETTGKNAGCWVMDWRQDSGPAAAGGVPEEGAGDGTQGDAGDGAKVIVRSNGTVTYVGKDIAYQLWKFGRLGPAGRPLEFHYQRRGESGTWTTTADPDGGGQDAAAPKFGRAHWVFNVIDSRQSYLQDVVRAGLRALGLEEEAQRSVHFGYEMVALTPRCAAELGYAPSAEEQQRTHLEVSGRKGLGVKADDLLDRLMQRAWAEVRSRHPEMEPAAQMGLAAPIAMGAARFFLLKYTRNALIAFDFQEALSFDGETGPYVQYAAVRAASILRKAETAEDTGPGAENTRGEAGDGAQAEAGGKALLAENDVWELLSVAARLEQTVAQALAAAEPAQMARYAFQLAQAFNNFYHRRPVLAERDAMCREMLLQLVRISAQRLGQALDLLGIEVPAAM